MIHLTFYMINYNEFVKRNSGYIDVKTQDKIKNTKILIAGCGIGSTITECLLRMGFVNLTLVDFDTVEISNLNRQDFEFSDVKKSKVDSLKKRLLNIFPEANIVSINEPLSDKNIKSMISSHDVILDTIDFLDLKAIITLHEESVKQKKPLISVVSAGFGAIGFIATKKNLLKSWMSIKNEKNLNEQYGFYLNEFLKKIKEDLSPEVYSVMLDMMDKLYNNIPCPAPHLSIGSFSSGALAGTLLLKILQKKDKSISNKLHFLDINKIIYNSK